MHDFSKPLLEPPSFLSTISMIVDDQREIINKLVQAERKSPSRYEPAKALFCRTLQGDLSFVRALEQARKVPDSIERQCAVEVLTAAEQFLRSERPAPIGPFPSMDYSLPNKLNVGISPVLLRHLDSNRLLILHLWQTPLSERQLGAAGAVLRKCLLRSHPNFASCELDFVSVSRPPNGTQRRLQLFNWEKLKLLDDEQLSKFWNLFCEAWSKYRAMEPRKIKRKREPSMFD